MLPRRRGLIVSTVAWAFDAYLGNLFYDVAKAAVVRLAFALGRELRPHGVAAVALAPGFMRTEQVLAAHEAEPFDLDPTESPEFLGRAVAALARDPDVLERSGRLLTAASSPASSASPMSMAASPSPSESGPRPRRGSAERPGRRRPVVRVVESI